MDEMIRVREAGAADAPAVAQLLYDFNREFDEPTPEVDVLAERVRMLLDADDAAILVTGEPLDGLAVLRLRSSLWSEGLEAYLAELYVVPENRRRGRGRALLEATLAFAREAGAEYIELGTSESDIGARALYESFGFTNRDPGGSTMYFYERQL